MPSTTHCFNCNAVLPVGESNKRLIDTTRFGTVSVLNNQIFTFEQPISQLYSCTEFALLHHTDNCPIYWLQATHNPDALLLVGNPTYFGHHYQPQLNAADLEAHGFTTTTEPIVLVVIDDTRQTTGLMLANFSRPLLLHPTNNTGCRLSVLNKDYDPKTPFIQQQTNKDKTTLVKAQNQAAKGKCPSCHIVIDTVKEIEKNSDRHAVARTGIDHFWCHNCDFLYNLWEVHDEDYVVKNRIPTRTTHYPFELAKVFGTFFAVIFLLAGIFGSGIDALAGIFSFTLLGAIWYVIFTGLGKVTAHSALKQHRAKKSPVNAHKGTQVIHRVGGQPAP